MNQVADEDVQSIKCSQMNTMKNKSKKAKDPSETTDDISILDPKLSEAIVNTLHINNINSNLTNGTSDHSKDSPKDISDKSEAQSDAMSGVAIDVNSVQSSNVDEGAISSTQMLRCNPGDELGNSQQAPEDDISIISYESELQMPEIMRLIQKDLSEPYSIYTYRYFIHNWPKLCFLATHEGTCIGAIVCKLDMHRNVVKRGYIAMLAVDKKYRKRGIGSRLVRKAIQVITNY